MAWATNEWSRKEPESKEIREVDVPDQIQFEPITVSKQNIEHLRKKWGKRYNAEGKASEYTKDELQDLESSYMSQAVEYKGAITPRIDMALQEISINRLEWKRAIGLGDSTAAKRFSDNIKSVMDREGLKANDEKPLESIRIDGVIHALERDGAAFDGRIRSRTELLQLIAEENGEYNTSLDVVDEIIFAIINTMRKNNSQDEYSALPREAQVIDAKRELKPRMTDRERKTMRELGLMPPMREK